MRPSPEAMRTLIIRCLQGCGNTASLSYPETWVRKPDCFHLPYRVPEGEEEKQEIENLFENIMKENFPNLAKEIDFQELQEAQRVPKKLDQRKHTPRHIIITLPKIKEKERILKEAREKETVTYKGVPTRLASDFSKETLQARRG